MGLYLLTPMRIRHLLSGVRLTEDWNWGQLPATTKYAVLPDPDGKRVGSGGATFNVLRFLAEENPDEENAFAG